MTSDQLRSMVQRRPFQPFEIHTADGQSIKVTHPENIAYAGGRVAAIVFPGDRLEIIDLLLVARISSDEPRPASESKAEGQ
jgi:hypothetical protein